MLYEKSKSELLSEELFENPTNEYRNATIMLLSWIVPNPGEVEQIIYDLITDQTGEDPLSKQVMEDGWGHWLQVGPVDLCVVDYDPEKPIYCIAIREHGTSKNMIGFTLE